MNEQRTSLIEEARKQKTPFWTRVADDLAKANRKRRIVNLSRLARVTNANDVVVVPGKVLGDGELSHKLTIAAMTFSEQARTKLEKAGSTVVSLEEFMKSKPKGKVRIIG